MFEDGEKEWRGVRKRRGFELRLWRERWRKVEERKASRLFLWKEGWREEMEGSDGPELLLKVEGKRRGEKNRQVTFVEGGKEWRRESGLG